MNNDKNHESHSIFICDRHHAELKGVDDVFSFDDMSISVHSVLGDLAIDGEELKIDNFSAEKGVLSISGKIIGIYYFDNSPKKHSSKKHQSR